MKLGKVDSRKSEVEMEGDGMRVASLAGGESRVLLGIPKKEFDVKAHLVEGEEVCSREGGIGGEEELLTVRSMMSANDNSELPLERTMPADVTVHGHAFLPRRRGDGAKRRGRFGAGRLVEPRDGRVLDLGRRLRLRLLAHLEPLLGGEDADR